MLDSKIRLTILRPNSNFAKNMGYFFKLIHMFTSWFFLYGSLSPQNVVCDDFIHLNCIRFRMVYYSRFLCPSRYILCYVYILCFDVFARVYSFLHFIHPPFVQIGLEQLFERIILRAQCNPADYSTPLHTSSRALLWLTTAYCHVAILFCCL